MPDEVRHGGCMHCGDRALVQMAWVRYGATAQQRLMCRRCWRVLKRQEQIITPQTAGKRLKKYARMVEEQINRYRCRHGIPEGVPCRDCRTERRERQRLTRQRIEEREREQQRQSAEMERALSWQEIVNSPITNAASYWSLNTTTNTSEIPRPLNDDEVLF